MKIHPVIIAGGSGTRFWPLSRKSRPKQFLPLGTSRPLIVDTALRLQPLSRVSDCYVVCGKAHATAVRKLLPKVPASQVLVEPMARNTAPAIGLAAAVIAQKDPTGILAILPSDHHVANAPAFRQALADAAGYAQDGALVALAVAPTRAETGYGYVQLGARLGRGPGHRVRAFVEKPDLARAKRYLAGGKHVWNAGIFVFRADAILGAIREHLPELSRGLDALSAHVGKRSFAGALARIFPTLPNISIDYGVLEKAKGIVVVPSAFGWSDVGSFAALPEVRDADAQGNVVGGLALPIDAQGCVILGQPDRPVAVVGVRELVVIDAGDAILVCPKSKAQEVRKVVDALGARNLKRFL